MFGDVARSLGGWLLSQEQSMAAGIACGPASVMGLSLDRFLVAGRAPILIGDNDGETMADLDDRRDDGGSMISLVVDRAVARLAMNKPAKRNALSLADWLALSTAVAHVGASRAHVLILLSNVPGSFSAGSDLSEIAELAHDIEGRTVFRQVMRDALDGLAGLSIPTIAAIDGDCMGAGVALALACDIRIGGADARFGVTPAKLGISYPQDDVRRLVGAVGRGQAARLLFTAGVIDQAEAARIGMVELMAPNALLEADALASVIALNAPSSLQILKAMLVSEDAQTYEVFDQAFDQSFASAALLEGLAAFKEHRRPNFSVS